MTIARTLHIQGRAQGVGFRAAARAEARRLGLTGFARNEADGSVTIEVEGEPDSIETFVAWCHQGPSGAAVVKVEVTAAEPQGRADFAVG